MKRFFRWLGAGFAALCLTTSTALADVTGTSKLPESFEQAVADLQKTGEAAADSITPMVTAIAIAFALIGLVLVGIRYFRRSAR